MNVMIQLLQLLQLLRHDSSVLRMEVAFVYLVGVFMCDVPYKSNCQQDSRNCRGLSLCMSLAKAKDSD